MQYWKLFTNNSGKMAPRVQTHLKFDEKVKVIQLYAEDSSLNFRKFTEKVKFRLNLSVSRSTVQRIIKDKDRQKKREK